MSAMVMEKEGMHVIWVNQVRAILRLEMKKNFLGKRSFLVYLMALLPVLISVFMATFPASAKELANSSNASNVFANFYDGLLLRTVVFFGSAWIFMNLFRGDLIDKSLHYYFLAPVRREVLVLGKYFSGLLNSSLLFMLMTAGCLFFIYYPRGYAASVDYIFNGPGAGQIFIYMAMTVLACLGYGAIFLVIGLFFRNPIIPAGLVYGWEWLNFLLPPVLKKMSVIYYVNSLAPVPINEGPLAIVADPASPFTAVVSLIVIATLVLGFACWRVRRMEITYASD